VSLPAAGPLPRFIDAQIRRALELIAERKGIGRKQLAKELGIGEGSIRTILSRLRNRSFIASSRSGQSITAKGKRELGKTLEYVQVDAGDLTVGDVDVATIVRKAAARVGRGIEQRDEAIKAGAAGATVLVYKDGKLQFPDGFQKVERNFANDLITTFKPSKGDVIIIGSGRDAVKAETGAKAAARSLT
jgi:DNA-binding PadR family transcriptional regulator